MHTFRTWAPDFMFLFWKKCFIEIKVAVQKKEAPLIVSHHEIIMRDYGHFLHRQNFPNYDTFKTQASTASNHLQSATENLKNIFTGLLQSEG